VLRSRAVLITLAAVICGFSFSFLDVHDGVSARAPLAGSVRPSAPMLDPRSGHTATLLEDGRVLIAGGMRRNQDFYRSAELYDPATGQFQATGAMNLARVGPAAALLQSGKVLIVGGFVGHACTNSAEMYDPVNGKFTTIGKMTAVRGNPSATLLADGDVLITGQKNWRRRLQRDFPSDRGPSRRKMRCGAPRRRPVGRSRRNGSRWPAPGPEDLRQPRRDSKGLARKQSACLTPPHSNT
jgi:Kelch motif/Galactose oxidase, central domain